MKSHPFTRLLGRQAVIVIHREVLLIAGSYEAAALLEQLAYLGESENDRFVIKTIDEWCNELCIKERSFRNAKQRLIDLNLLEEKQIREARGHTFVNLNAMRTDPSLLLKLLEGNETSPHPNIMRIVEGDETSPHPSGLRNVRVEGDVSSPHPYDEWGDETSPSRARGSLLGFKKELLQDKNLQTRDLRTTDLLSAIGLSDLDENRFAVIEPAESFQQPEIMSDQAKVGLTQPGLKDSPGAARVERGLETRRKLSSPRTLPKRVRDGSEATTDDSKTSVQQLMFKELAEAVFGGLAGLTISAKSRIGKTAKSMIQAGYTSEDIPKILDWFIENDWRKSPSSVEQIAEAAPKWKNDHRAKKTIGNDPMDAYRDRGI